MNINWWIILLINPNTWKWFETVISNFFQIWHFLLILLNVVYFLFVFPSNIQLFWNLNWIFKLYENYRFFVKIFPDFYFNFQFLIFSPPAEYPDDWELVYQCIHSEWTNSRWSGSFDKHIPIRYHQFRPACSDDSCRGHWQEITLRLVGLQW